MTNITFSEIRRRLKAPTPIFWKRMARILLSVGGSCFTALLGSSVTNYPEWLIGVLGVGIGAGVAGLIMANLTEDTQGATEEEINAIIKKQVEALEKQKEVKQIIKDQEVE